MVVFVEVGSEASGDLGLAVSYSIDSCHSRTGLHTSEFGGQQE